MSNSVLGESPNIVYLEMSPANTGDKLKYVFAPDTIFEGFTDDSECILSMNGYKDVTVVRVSEMKLFSKYIKNSEFETTKFF